MLVLAGSSAQSGEVRSATSSCGVLRGRGGARGRIGGADQLVDLGLGGRAAADRADRDPAGQLDERHDRDVQPCITPLVVSVLLAQRRLALVECADDRHAVVGHRRRERVLARAPGGVPCVTVIAGLVGRVEDPDVSEQGARAPVADRRDLPGLSLAAVEGPTEHPRLRAADGLHGAPEVGGGRLVGDVAELASDRAVADLEEPLTGELEVVALHVDAPRPVADDVDAAVDASTRSSVDRGLRARLKRHVGHPLDGDVLRRVGECTPVRALPAPSCGDAAVGLVADEDAVLDEVPLLLGDAVVVVPDRRQTVLDDSVASDVEELGAVLQAAELVDGRERRAGVVGLVSEGAVELGRVPDALVDRQPEIGRIDDEIVGAGLNARGRQLVAELAGQGRRARPPSRSRLRRDTPSRGRSAARSSASSRRHRSRGRPMNLDHRVEAHSLLGGRRAVGVGVELVLAYLVNRRRDVLDGRVLPSRLLQSASSSTFSDDRHIERVHVVRRDPCLVVVDRFGGDLDRRAAIGWPPGPAARRLGYPNRLVDGQRRAGGEPPRPAVDDPNREADVVGFERGLEHAVADHEVLVAEPLEAEVRVAGTQLLRPAKGDRAEIAVGEGGEGRIDLRHGSNLSAP